MNKKPKFKQEVVNQLKRLIEDYSIYENKALLLNRHSDTINKNKDILSWDKERYPLLNDLSVADMYDLLHDNYEIKKLTKEEFLEKFKKNLDDSSYVNGVLDFLDAYEIKVVGINK